MTSIHCLHCGAMATGGPVVFGEYTRCSACSLRLKIDHGADAMPPVNPRTGKPMAERSQAVRNHRSGMMESLRYAIINTVQNHYEANYGFRTDEVFRYPEKYLPED